MILKQIHSNIFIPLVLLATALVIFLSTALLSERAYAYSCPDGYEYHDDSATGGNGECWKTRFTERSGSDAPRPPKPVVNGTTVACPDGSAPTSGSKQNQCTVSCPAGDDTHTDTNTCWYRNGYTIEDTQKVAPTTNDGQALNGDNGKCTDGFVYLTSKDPHGCYKQASDGTFPCGLDQSITASRAGQSCKDADKNHLVPKDPSHDNTQAPQPTNTTCPNNGQVDATTGKCPDGSAPTTTTDQQVNNPAAKETFGSCGTHGTDDKPVETVLIGCEAGVCNTGGGGWSSAFKGTPVIACVIKFGISALTVLVGVGAVAGIAWEAFKYAKAQDDQSAVSDARKRMRDIVIGLIIYIFMAVAINWLVPGGVIGG